MTEDYQCIYGLDKLFCRKIEGIAENYTIQIDDIIEDIKKLAIFANNFIL